MGLLIQVIIAAVVALIVYWVATALIHFQHSNIIIGLACLALFLIIAFGYSHYSGRGRGVPPT